MTVVILARVVVREYVKNLLSTVFKMFSEEIGQDIYILREMDARFKKQEEVDLNKAKLIIRGNK